MLFSFRFLIFQKAKYPLWFLSGAVFISHHFENMWPLVRIYRGGFLLIQFLFLLGINTYGWRQAGVNHVLIFEINPRNNLSHQHLFEVRKSKIMKKINFLSVMKKTTLIWILFKILISYKQGCLVDLG